MKISRLDAEGQVQWHTVLEDKEMIQMCEVVMCGMLTCTDPGVRDRSRHMIGGLLYAEMDEQDRERMKHLKSVPARFVHQVTQAVRANE